MFRLCTLNLVLDQELNLKKPSRKTMDKLHFFVLFGYFKIQILIINLIY